MGYITEWLKKKGKPYYWIDWLLDIILAITFIYLSLQVREMALRCSCPIIPLNLTNTSFNITNGGTG